MDLQKQYDSGMQEIREFLYSGTTWKDLMIEEFSEKSRFFKSLLVLSEFAMRNNLYAKGQLDEDLRKIRQAIKRLLL